MKRAYIIGAQRTAVVPRGGAFCDIEVAELAAPLFLSLLETTSLEPSAVDSIILGNALYGGGNPARTSGLLAGFPENIPALTIDTQCCSGMDAIGLAIQQILSGKADAVVAGGVESFSRSPLRLKRPLIKEDDPVPYNRPPFTPWPDRDPDMLLAASQLAEKMRISRISQEAFAIKSHSNARQRKELNAKEIIPIAEIDEDQFTRELTPQFCERLKPIAGTKEHALTAATTAVEADAAAAVVVVCGSKLEALSFTGRALEVIDCVSLGGDPTMPALVPIAATKKILERNGVSISDVRVVEIMEAFAIQAMTFLKEMGVDPSIVNRGGGALARGHPIGASGTINVVRLWHELQKEPEGSLGLAAIAAAGGLGTALMGRVLR